MEKLEKFIKENRPSFDDKTPDRSIWIGIEQKLDKQDSNKIIQLRWFKVAAGVILILCCGILIGLNLNNFGSRTLNYAANPELLKYKDAESYYALQVNLKYNELKDTTIKANVDEDLKQLDIIYQQLKDEMIRSNYTNSEILIDSMIKNHKTKIEILENILNKQNQNNNENESMSL